MVKPEIILVGSGGHALSCFDVLERENKYQIVGLVSPNGVTNNLLKSFPILGTDSDIPMLVTPNVNFLICVGQIKTPDPRINLYEKIISAGGRLPTIVSPLAHVSSHAKIGAGSIIMHGAIINAGVAVGENCIINTGAIIDHEVVVKSHSHISTGVILNGQVEIGMGSFIGSGSIIKHGVHICDRSVVPMKSVINHNFIKVNKNYK
jgi:sugar O-acyltransferase (sialic acid O-acetyltransferase NeuD family)